MYGFPLGNMAENQQKVLSSACANKICSAHSAPFWNFLVRFCGLSTGRSTPFCHIFWRGMKEHDRFTTISNSVDTRGVFWFFGWAILSANKTRKKAENLKFEICLTHDRDVHMRLQIFKVSLKMLMSYFYKSRSCVWKRSWDIRYDNRR